MTPSRPRSRMAYPPSLEAGVTSVVYPSERNMSAQKPSKPAGWSAKAAMMPSIFAARRRCLTRKRESPWRGSSRGSMGQYRYESRASSNTSWMRMSCAAAQVLSRRRVEARRLTLVFTQPSPDSGFSSFRFFVFSVFGIAVFGFSVSTGSGIAVSSRLQALPRASTVAASRV